MDGVAPAQLAERLAPRLRTGDFIGLTGGPSAAARDFARALVRALTDSETPPTAALAGRYEGARFAVHVVDWPAAQTAAADGIVIALCAENPRPALPADRLEIAITADAATAAGFGTWSPRVERFAALGRFLRDAGWGQARATYVNGDASTRSYARLAADGQTAMLMDWPRAPDGPPIRGNRPYSQIAHLAENVRPFVAVAEALRMAGLPAPRILAVDEPHGFLLLEDFGDEVFTTIAARGEDIFPHYRLAVDALLALRAHPPAANLPTDAGAHVLPAYDREALHIETELLTDWLLPAIRGADIPPAVRAEFTAAWDEQFDWLLAQPKGWVLRDYHSPNLIWRGTEEGLRRLGLIDFQDALYGHSAYDMVSLLQDARLDLPEHLEAELLGHYCDAAARVEPGFDGAAFLRAYRLLGAQRNTKILGIFTRLARRDGKRAYLRHMPRIARYLTADLTDPALARLQAWYVRELPGGMTDLAARI